MDEKEIIIFKKPSKWTAWRLQRVLPQLSVLTLLV